ncbi:hypothetical protein SCHPADRAFT_417454 [Schizopora paradoxa]|uniref:Uncharacterized protein n=1 Tax=Schizopora paradoxa TaxID=27342 RepID=A0A0H2RLN1_9AGAM|nr:hypothetical protein SCHPADRAFT_417454 [Schizopora paradoxa]
MLTDTLSHALSVVGVRDGADEARAPILVAAGVPRHYRRICFPAFLTLHLASSLQFIHLGSANQVKLPALRGNSAIEEEHAFDVAHSEVATVEADDSVVVIGERAVGTMVRVMKYLEGLMLAVVSAGRAVVPWRGEEVGWARFPTVVLIIVLWPSSALLVYVIFRHDSCELHWMFVYRSSSAHPFGDDFFALENRRSRLAISSGSTPSSPLVPTRLVVPLGIIRVPFGWAVHSAWTVVTRARTGRLVNSSSIAGLPAIRPISRSIESPSSSALAVRSSALRVPNGMAFGWIPSLVGTMNFRRQTVFTPCDAFFQLRSISIPVVSFQAIVLNSGMNIEKFLGKSNAFIGPLPLTDKDITSASELAAPKSSEVEKSERSPIESTSGTSDTSVTSTDLDSERSRVSSNGTDLTACDDLLDVGSKREEGSGDGSGNGNMDEGEAQPEIDWDFDRRIGSRVFKADDDDVHEAFVGKTYNEVLADILEGDESDDSISDCFDGRTREEVMAEILGEDEEFPSEEHTCPSSSSNETVILAPTEERARSPCLSSASENDTLVFDTSSRNATQLARVTVPQSANSFNDSGVSVQRFLQHPVDAFSIFVTWHESHPTSVSDSPIFKISISRIIDTLKAISPSIIADLSRRLDASFFRSMVFTGEEHLGLVQEKEYSLLDDLWDAFGKRSNVSASHELDSLLLLVYRARLAGQLPSWTRLVEDSHGSIFSEIGLPPRIDDDDDDDVKGKKVEGPTDEELEKAARRKEEAGRSRHRRIRSSQGGRRRALKRRGSQESSAIPESGDAVQGAEEESVRVQCTTPLEPPQLDSPKDSVNPPSGAPLDLLKVMNGLLKARGLNEVVMSDHEVRAAWDATSFKIQLDMLSQQLEDMGLHDCVPHLQLEADLHSSRPSAIA